MDAVTLTPVGDRELRFDLHINGVHTDDDVVEFNTRGDRNRNFANVVGEYRAAGYTKR